MRVLLAGASGAIGWPLVRRLVSEGHEVVAIHRAAEAGGPLAAAGADPVRVDVLDRGRLVRVLRRRQCDAVISQLTALKKLPLRERDMAATNRLRTQGTANLVVAAEAVGASRILTQSMVFGYGYRDHGPRLLTEDDDFGGAGPGRFADTVAAMGRNEQQVLARNGVALRYGLFYGTGPAGDTLVDGLRRRRLPVVRRGGVLPWIHVDDAVAATVAALELGTGGRVYNVVDDEPVSFATLLRATAAALGAPAPRVLPAALLRLVPYAGAVMTGGLRVSNARAGRELGWRPRFPSYRLGVDDLVEHYRQNGSGQRGG